MDDTTALQQIPVEHQNQRILTTAQVAEAYGTDANHIGVNFHRNKDRYTEGKHYFCLEGEELKQFKADYLTICKVDPRASTLYLWTEKGAWLLAKSLNTDEAWHACEMLVDTYYRQKDQIARLQQQIIQLQQRFDSLDGKPRQSQLPGMRKLSIPECGYHVTSDRIQISPEQERALVVQYVKFIWHTHKIAPTAGQLSGCYVKRLPSHRALLRLEEAVYDGELERFFTPHTRRTGGKFKPLSDDAS